MERYGLEKEFSVFTAFLESKNGYFTHKCPT